MHGSRKERKDKSLISFHVRFSALCECVSEEDSSGACVPNQDTFTFFFCLLFPNIAMGRNSIPPSTWNEMNSLKINSLMAHKRFFADRSKLNVIEHEVEKKVWSIAVR